MIQTDPKRLNILPSIRNISYKELIPPSGSENITFTKELEIYPIRNWYADFPLELIGMGISLEIYPIRNWYAPPWLLSVTGCNIRNISYKELIRTLALMAISPLLVIRNISYKELILVLPSFPISFVSSLEIYPIRNWYLELLL